MIPILCWGGAGDSLGCPSLGTLGVAFELGAVISPELAKEAGLAELGSAGTLLLLPSEHWITSMCSLACVFPFNGSLDQIQVFTFVQQALYPPSHLSRP